MADKCALPTIIVDTKEKKPWTFSEGMVRRGLPTGDYTLDGYEGAFVIERKGTSGELAKNLVQGRFEKELGRLEEIRWGFIICEFTMADILAFPLNSGIHPSRWRQLKIRAPFFLRRFLEIQMRYRTKIILAGPNGKDVALSLFKRVIDCGEEKIQPS